MSERPPFGRALPLSGPQMRGRLTYERRAEHRLHALARHRTLRSALTATRSPPRTSSAWPTRDSSFARPSAPPRPARRAGRACSPGSTVVGRAHDPWPRKGRSQPRSSARRSVRRSRNYSGTESRMRSGDRDRPVGGGGCRELGERGARPRQGAAMTGALRRGEGGGTRGFGTEAGAGGAGGRGRRRATSSAAPPPSPSPGRRPRTWSRGRSGRRSTRARSAAWS